MVAGGKSDISLGGRRRRLLCLHTTGGDVTNQTLNIDGINIAFTRRGTGPSMLLIHGYPLDRSIWDQVAPLLEAEFDLIIPDLRGFGASDVMEADRSIIEYATDLAGLMERLRIRRARIVGHSMGGYVALAFA